MWNDRDRGVVTLTTDFGLSDPRVGVMKGVILSIYPALSIVDITHDIPPQDVARAAHVIGSFGHSFPHGTVHVAVVDPGVGANREAVILQTERYFYVGPNNGIFTMLDSEPVKMVRIKNPAFLLPKMSVTFHGRDLFAPVAAHLFNTPIEDFGPPLEQRVTMEMPRAARAEDGSIRGEITGFDRFGNAFTNIPESLLIEAGGAPGKHGVSVSVGRTAIPGLSFYYQSVSPGKPGAIINGFALLEIFTPNASARSMLGLNVGDAVTVTFKA